jgi:hypothetical protein
MMSTFHSVIMMMSTFHSVIMMMSTFHSINTLRCIFIMLAHKNSSPLDMSDTWFWFPVKQYLLLIL